MKEVWKDITDYEGLYQVSNLGRVKSLERYKNNHSKKILIEGKILNSCLTCGGYCMVSLSKNNKKQSFIVHRLVAEAFIPNPDNKPEINHNDGNKQNNCVSNLFWVTHRENVKHAFDNNLHKMKRINQYDSSGNFIKSWDNIRAIKKETKFYIPNIYACCLGQRPTAGNYIWKYADTE